MGRGAKKTTKLVKPEKQEKGKTLEDEEVLVNVRQPSPIPEEAESGFAAQSNAPGDEQGGTSHDLWNTGEEPQVWQGSAHPSRAATPRSRDHRSIVNPAAPGGPSQTALSWAEPDTASSLDSRSHQYPASPHPGQTQRLGAESTYVNFERGESESNKESELDYVNEQQFSGMNPNLNIHHQQNATTQGRSHTVQQAPSAHPGQQPPAFPVYATSLSSHPVAPNPPPAPPNVLSKASDAAARRDKTKQGDLPPQPGQVRPLPPAAWHSWRDPRTYAPAPPVQPSAPPLTPISEAPSSIPKPPRSNPARGIWDLKHGKGQPPNNWVQSPRGRQGVLPNQWGQRQRQMSADGWDTYRGGTDHGRGDHGAWNDGGLEQANSNNAWYGNDGSKKGHGRSQSAGGWTRKRNVQWEEETSSDDTEDGEDGWGEDEAGQWDQADGWNKTNDGWGKSGWDGASAKADQGWGAVRDGWDQGRNGWPDQSSGVRNWENGRHVQNAMNDPSIARAALPPQERFQIMNSMLNMTDQRRGDQAARFEQASNGLSSRNDKKDDRRRTMYNAGWGLEDDSWGNARDDEDGRGSDRRLPAVPSKRASNNWDAWGGSQDASRYSMPSLTLAHAYKDMKTRIDSGAQHSLDDFTRIRFHESGGVALIPAQNALLNHSRLARDRIYWIFPPDKDERVKAALSWVQEMTYGLGTLGLHKFLQHRERGALVINADHRVPDKPNEFAVDYLTFDNLQKSMDKTLQASVISYDPSVTTIVFVLLPSKTGNSIAAWRRKLHVPNNSRLRFQKELSIALLGLKDPKSYLVYVDELPGEKKDSSKDAIQKAKTKRKWWQFFSRSKT